MKRKQMTVKFKSGKEYIMVADVENLPSVRCGNDIEALLISKLLSDFVDFLFYKEDIKGSDIQSITFDT